MSKMPRLKLIKTPYTYFPSRKQQTTNHHAHSLSLTHTHTHVRTHGHTLLLLRTHYTEGFIKRCEGIRYSSKGLNGERERERERERDGRAGLVTLKELSLVRTSSYKPSTVQSEATYYNTCVHVTGTDSHNSPQGRSYNTSKQSDLTGGGHQRRKWTPTLAITTTPHPMAGLLLIHEEDFLLVSQGKQARAQRYTCNTTPFIIGLTINCHEHTIETIIELT